MRRSVQLPAAAGIELWRERARQLLSAETKPEDVDWSVGDSPDLVAAPSVQSQLVAANAERSRVPRDFIHHAGVALMHADPGRFALLYRMLWRVTHGEPRLLDLEVDADVAKLAAMMKAVQRDMHKMKAFVRFRAIPSLPQPGQLDPEPVYMAWFEPEHHILAAVAPFFMRRFTNMSFSLVTPELSAFWDRRELWFGPGGNKAQLPTEDASEDLWRVYYSNIFNPARLKLAAMTNEMPKKYWRNLPEASLIEELSHAAPQRVAVMIDDSQNLDDASLPSGRKPLTMKPAMPVAAPIGALAKLRVEAAACRDCDLWQNATQTVFGQGAQAARVMLVGEQPGDQEDLAGQPFVGPAGQLLDRALEEAGIARDRLYVTNAVKHFKFVVRGKRRLHQSPDVREIEVCSQWLAREIEAMQPQLIVALGASAARALFQRAMPIKANRGRVTSHNDLKILVTVHPSYLLRLPDKETQQKEYGLFVEDLKVVASHLAHPNAT